MSVQVRPITASDEQAWLPLWHGYNVFYNRVDSITDEITTKTFSRFLDDSIRLYCAVAVDTESSKLIGFTTWLPHVSTATIEDTVYLQDLFVDPSIRNKGAGKLLIEYVYERAKNDLGASSVYWHTQRFNHRAQLLYVKVADLTDRVQYKKIL